MRTDLVLDALRMARGTREHGADVDLVHHSDAARTSASAAPKNSDDAGVLASLGSVGDAYDDAMLHSSIGKRPSAEHETDWRLLAARQGELAPSPPLVTLNAAGETTPTGSFPTP